LALLLSAAGGTGSARFAEAGVTEVQTPNPGPAPAPGLPPAPGTPPSGSPGTPPPIPPPRSP